MPNQTDLKKIRRNIRQRAIQYAHEPAKFATYFNREFPDKVQQVAIFESLNVRDITELHKSQKTKILRGKKTEIQKSYPGEKRDKRISTVLYPSQFDSIISCYGSIAKALDSLDLSLAGL